MRAARWGLFFVVGLFLGGGSVYAFAANVLWQSRDSVVIRAADGQVKAIPGIRQLLENMPDGSGGVTARATQPLSVNGSGAAMNLSKPVSRSAVATAGRIAARLSGPVALAGLAYEGYGLLFDEETQEWQAAAETQQNLGYLGQPVNYSDPGWCGLGLYANTCGTAQIVGRTVADGGGWAGYPTTAIQVTQLADAVNGWETRATMYCSGYPCAHLKRNPLWTATLAYATDALLEQGIFEAIGANPSLAPTILDNGIQAGYVPESGPVSVTGPSTIPGPTTTSSSSGPSGQTTTTSTTNYDLTYNTNVVSITSNTTTTVTAPDGQQTVTTTSAAPGGDGVAPPEQPSLCEEFPNASACQELGDPDDEELEEQDETVTWEAEGSAAGSCPAPKPWATHGQTYMIEWNPICDFASGMRPFVIGVAWLTAGLFIFMVAKEKA